MAPAVKKKTFVDMLTSTPPVPPVFKPQSPWEVYMMGELKKLQQDVITLRADLSAKDAKIKELETQLQTITIQQAEDREAAQKQCIKDEANTICHEDIPKVKSENFVDEVLSVLKENEKIKSFERYLRVGGLPNDWAVGTLPDEHLEGYVLDVDILKERLSKVVPFVDLGEPTDIEVKGKQARVRYYDVDDKIKVMKQTKSLQGTSVWISDELTPTQLKNRAKELAKVREARKQGKWAVYRGGKALIREFKSPTPFTKTWT